ncbi:MAG TPA: ABC transporter permease [Actinobacteria bacterium]|nr:ABC transporter permease [Actinomycetota bacterium]
MTRMDAVAQQAADLPDDSETLHERKHPSHWVVGLLVLCVLGFLCFALANANIGWEVIPKYLTSATILSGLEKTLLISALAMLVGLALGVIFAAMRLSKNPVTSAIAWLYVWLFRGTPVFVQLLIWFNLALIFPGIGIPGVFHVQTVKVITPFLAALLGLGINEGAYLTEIIRGGILSVDSGQTHASVSLGLSRRRTLRHVILPQAMPAILPTIGNESIGMLKYSALAAVIGYTELLQRAQTIYYVNGRVMELLFVASIWYLAATSATSIAQYYLEQHFGRSEVRRRSVADRLLRSGISHLRARSA